MDNEYHKEVMDIVYLLEIYLKRPVGTGEFQTILNWVENYHMSLDLIQYLIELSFKKEKANIKYMDAIAKNWYLADLKTVEEAKKYSKIRDTIIFPIKNAMQIYARDLIKPEIEIIEEWARKYEFSTEIYEEACKRTIKSTGKPTFKYTDKILNNWKRAGVKNLGDIEKLDDAYNYNNKQYTSKLKNVPEKKKNKFHNFNEREYTSEQMNELEKKLLGF